MDAQQVRLCFSPLPLLHVLILPSGHQPPNAVKSIGEARKEALVEYARIQDELYTKNLIERVRLPLSALILCRTDRFPSPATKRRPDALPLGDSASQLLLEAVPAKPGAHHHYPRGWDFQECVRD
jgi:hypothetical protein